VKGRRYTPKCRPYTLKLFDDNPKNRPQKFALQRKTTLKKSVFAASALIAAVVGIGAAYAHPELQSAEPAAGEPSPAPNSVLPQFSGIELKDQTGKVISTGKTTTDPSNKKLMIVPVKDQLMPGNYEVEWHAVSDDTHRVKGRYSFSVAP
jgi:methionine-rich copper-binding protein CopC